MISTAAARPDSPLGPVFVVGCGAVGTALVLALDRSGVPVCGASCRTEPSARRAAALTGRAVAHGPVPPEVGVARVILLAVPDPEIRRAAEGLVSSSRLSGQQLVLHCSGVRPASDLASVREHSAGVGSFHPLLSFAVPAAASVLLSRAAFALEGDPAAVEAGRALAGALGGTVLAVAAEDRALYHAAAAVASNHLVALCSHAARCLLPLGLPRDGAVSALATLMASTVASIEAVGLPAALTGPVCRGDAAAVQAHLRALESKAPGERSLYEALAAEALALARERGSAPSEGLAELARLLGRGRSPGRKSP